MTATPEEYIEDPERSLDATQRAWLQPLGPLRSALHRGMYALAWSCMRLAFRLTVENVDRVPRDGPVIFSPNHTSALDAPLLASALPYRVVKNMYWAGRKGKVLANPLVRFLNRSAQVIPIDRDPSALAAGAAVLDRGCHIVWFPEGTRTRDGELLEFKPGVGALACHAQVPVVPVGVEGAFEAFPPGAWLPRFGATITVRFGEPLVNEDLEPSLCEEGDPEEYRDFADELRERVADLSNQPG